MEIVFGGLPSAESCDRISIVPDAPKTAKVPPTKPESGDQASRPNTDEEDEILLAGGFAVLGIVFNRRRPHPRRP
jgi:hypothetical protein